MPKPKKLSAKKKQNVAAGIMWGIIIVTAVGYVIYRNERPNDVFVSKRSDISQVDDKKLGLSFRYPSRWGSWTLDPSPSSPNAFGVTEMTFSELADTAKYPNSKTGGVRFIFRKYDEKEYKYEKMEGYDGIIESIDLPQDKRELLQNAKQSIAGIPANIVEHYDVPSGYVIRTIRFYTPTYRIDMYASYDIGDFLVANGGNDVNKSLGDIAQKILGEDLHDPITRLSEMYPNDLQKMTMFFKDVDHFVESIKVAQ